MVSMQRSAPRERLSKSVPEGGRVKVALLSIVLVWMQPAFAAGHAAFHEAYDQLLRTYWRPPVVVNGIPTTVLDYAALKRDAAAPDSLYRRALDALARTDPGRLSGDEAKAFWINAYNIGAIRLVVDNYPVDSIRSLKISLLKYPWSKKAVTIGGRPYSLREIEKDILLPRFGDPRIVFAVSCAAVSCPDRMPEAFAGDLLDRQLEALLQRFFANPAKGARLDRLRGVLTLSWILKKDADLFEAQYGGVLAFVRPYLPREDRDWLLGRQVEIRYFDHDWTLNDLAQADR